jgi:hypothetical protein
MCFRTRGKNYLKYCTTGTVDIATLTNKSAKERLVRFRYRLLIAPSAGVQLDVTRDERITRGQIIIEMAVSCCILGITIYSVCSPVTSGNMYLARGYTWLLFNLFYTRAASGIATIAPTVVAKI